MALDQGTTSSRAILFDQEHAIVAMAQKEYTQHYPREGWVEHDPLEIYSSQYGVMMELITQLDVKATKIAAIGITNQRETTILCGIEKGDVKNTYGTGCFLLMNTGDAPVFSQNGLIATIAASADGAIRYALEGSVFSGGATIQWLRDETRFFAESSDSEYYAGKVPDNGGVYFVPAFSGLGAPYWDMHARGCIIGITRGTKREHIIRAAQESIAYQSADLVGLMEQDTGIAIDELRVDGGASRDGFLMQFQADILGAEVKRPAVRETTALGAAFLAGLAAGVWRDHGEIRSRWQCGKTFTPAMVATDRERLLRDWRRAVARSREWIVPGEE